MPIPLTDVPLELRRLAAQHLESLHGSELMSGADDARLGSHASPVYRPDIDDIAYYEFTVVGSGGGRRRMLLTRGYADAPKMKASVRQKAGAGAGDKGTDDGTPIGFIVATNGRHDFPIAHWSLDRLPPSIQVGREPDAELERDQRPDVEIGRLYRLDALSYAAENKAGELVGQSGQLPGLVTGLPHSLQRFAGQIAHATAQPRSTQPTDADAEGAEHRTERSKDRVPALEQTDEGGWPALKERYADAFGPLLDQLRSRAARVWELEDAIREYGEGIVAGTTHRVALLDEAEIELSGEGTKYVDASVEQNRAGPPTLILRAAAASLTHEANLEVHLRYRSGEEEDLLFFVVSRDVPSNAKAEQSSQRDADCEE